MQQYWHLLLIVSYLELEGKLEAPKGTWALHMEDITSGISIPFLGSKKAILISSFDQDDLRIVHEQTGIPPEHHVLRCSVSKLSYAKMT